ncbi:hypothetical protein C8A05DRAFT_42567 [Staphylotrichum tortipilum]|uniref:RING-type E3 ubiquitin transferase n=1 Tax=Staphylotrichum tortipilum TaxID=2831512 RepID=A0AAN6RVB2_9PEZI|nr:hypothetical protein C8A05DRAFT_42567 [Staphylotrichum longicolle]
MFTQSAASPTAQGPGSRSLALSAVTAAAPTPASSSTATATPPSAARTSRLRGLSYLRNYTQTHLLSREHAPQQQPQQQQPQQQQQQPHPPASSSPPAASGIWANPWFGSSTSTSTPTPAVPEPDNSAAPPRTNRLSQLVPAFAHPLGLSTSHSTTAGRSPAPVAAPGRRSSDSSAVPFLAVPTPTRDIPPPPAAADDMTRARSATAGDAAGSLDTLPSIRFSTFFDPRATRPSLKFAPISRTLPSGREVIRVGRYSERDNQPNAPANTPSAAPVGFKSKVVSRRHCEFWYEDGKWYIKDVKSSSGTFLNHIRLSPPGTESKPYAINDGDVVQLGIDFKGGEEMIFRCVKMRLELNRDWQNKLNTFNSGPNASLPPPSMATHKRLRNMTAGIANGSSQDCSICLNNIAPCQCLFVAPCSHTWHYKCIRSLLAGPSYPIFNCPNCRAAADLEAEVEDPEEWEQLDSDEGVAGQEGALLQPPPVDANNPTPLSAPPRKSKESVRSARFLANLQQSQPAAEVLDVTMLLDPSPPDKETFPVQFDGASAFGAAGVLTHTTSNPMPIPSPAQRIQPDGRRETRTPSPPGAPVTNGPEGPITPRNDAGPWVFDGSGGGSGHARVTSLEAAVQAVGARLSREDDHIS